MGLRKGTPGKGEQGRTDTFSYTPVASGTKAVFAAWMAGDPYWALAHEHTKATPGTKPCLDWMTEGAVRCPRCRPHVRPTWVGWVPLYREEDHRAILVIVHEAAMDLLTGLGFPTRVLVGRCDDTSSVFVRRAEQQRTFSTENQQRKASRDITADLLSMWGLPDLENWLLEQRRAPRDSPLKSDGKPFSPEYRAAAERYSGSNDVATESDELFRAAGDRMLNRVKDRETSANGKPKPKG